MNYFYFYIILCFFSFCVRLGIYCCLFFFLIHCEVSELCASFFMYHPEVNACTHFAFIIHYCNNACMRSCKPPERHTQFPVQKSTFVELLCKCIVSMYKLYKTTTMYIFYLHVYTCLLLHTELMVSLFIRCTI